MQTAIQFTTAPTTNSTNSILSNPYSGLNFWHPWNWMSRENNVKANCSSAVCCVFIFFRVSLFGCFFPFIFSERDNELRSLLSPSKVSLVTTLYPKMCVGVTCTGCVRRNSAGTVFTFRSAWEKCFRKQTARSSGKCLCFCVYVTV